MLIKESGDLADLCANTGGKHILKTFHFFSCKYIQFLCDFFSQEFPALYKLKNEDNLMSKSDLLKLHLHI